MAIKISGTTVIDDSRNVDNIGTACATCWFGDGSNITGISANPLVLTPVNSSPTDGATDIGDGPTLCASTYYSLYGVSMCCSQWQVDDDSDFSSPVFNLCCSGTGTSVTLSSGTLCTSCTYYWRVRYFDNCGCCSDYSTATCFTTLSEFAPSTLGESIAGGYYIGTICAASTCYYLIVAPNATGSACCVYQSGGNRVFGSSDSCNGYNNTYTYLNTSASPAGNFTATRTIGGYSDWYLPGWQEMEQFVTNVNCVPVGERACNAGGYWTSSEISANNVNNRCFSFGGPSNEYKDRTCPTRAMRRVPF